MTSFVDFSTIYGIKSLENIEDWLHPTENFVSFHNGFCHAISLACHSHYNPLSLSSH